MQVSTSEEERQDARLADALAALASPVRLSLLREVRTPKVLREIRVRSDGPSGGTMELGDRPISRQAVRNHLERLIRAGVVLPRDADRAYGATTEYVVNHQAVFALSEEFRSLALLRPPSEPAGETLSGANIQSPYELRGPCLVVVKGLEEGRTFDLAPPAEGEREWWIGRRRSADVALDFDPYVSSANARIVWRDGAHHVHDSPDSRNGTTLNFKRLPSGGAHVLRTGDVIGVGRTILLFRD